jgi:hypothetical protein
MALMSLAVVVLYQLCCRALMLLAVVVLCQLCCSTDDQRGLMEHLMVEAMNTRLGLKSVWAKDINEATLVTLLK